MWGTMREMFHCKSVDNNAVGSMFRVLCRWELEVSLG
jgi:hypothetical protein